MVLGYFLGVGGGTPLGAKPLEARGEAASFKESVRNIQLSYYYLLILQLVVRRMFV